MRQHEPSGAAGPRPGARGHVALHALAVLWALWAPGAAAEELEDAAGGGGLRAQLRAFAAAEGLVVGGLERVGEASSREILGESLAARLEALLFGYNYLLVHDVDGAIVEVQIVGLRPPEPTGPPRYYVPVTRRGPHHEVQAVLVGPSGAWQELSMIVDTGASTVVLPASAIAGLAFRESDLEEGWTETAGGRVEAKTGTLASVTIGQAVARDVAVVFVADEKIGDKALLGMSFLDRFRLSFAETGDQIILTAK